MNEVANVIIKQIGGSSRLIAMIGANNFATSGNDLSFRFKGSPVANYIKITLNSSDLYDVEFGKVRGTNYKVVKEYNDVFFDQLIKLFEETTKLYLTL